MIHASEDEEHEGRVHFFVFFVFSDYLSRSFP